MAALGALGPVQSDVVQLAEDLVILQEAGGVRIEGQRAHRAPETPRVPGLVTHLRSMVTLVTSSHDGHKPHLQQPLVVDDLSAAVAGVVHKAALLLDADVVGVVMILDLVKLGPGGSWVGVRQELRLGILDLLLDLGHSGRHLDGHDGYYGILWSRMSGMSLMSLFNIALI